jgi:hypothetical protein
MFGEKSVKLCIKSLISHDIAERQWYRSHPSPYFTREIKIHQKMSTKIIELPQGATPEEGADDGNDRPTALSTKPRCTRLTPSSANERAENAGIPRRQPPSLINSN